MNPIFWLDLETTGLNPHTDLILEVGIAVSDGLDHIVDHRSIVIDHGGIHLPPEVLTMHLDSGLLADIAIRGLKERDAWRHITNFLTTWGDNRDNLVMGGSGIDRFDRPFMRASEVWCDVDDRFGFRTIDTSSLKNIYRRIGRPVPGYGGDKHRALDDAKDSFLLAAHAAELLTHPPIEVPA